ncbi:MAG: hypothetical protein L0170_20055 [Acidobacteria bacterium]|nr:hypothetical protein [Acidobacteriota bacterium]
MKIGFYGESPADQAGMAVLTEGILGAPPELIDMDLAAHGVTSVLQGLDGVFRGLHYLSNAEGLVVVVDSDNTELHDASHELPGQAAENCRLCQVRQIVTRAQKQVKTRQGRLALKIAIGLAVPSIEAWYLVGKEHQVGEAVWRVGLKANHFPFTRPQLKELVYGTDRPSLDRMIEYVLTEKRRIIGNLSAIETAFPDGFGLMAQAIRSWTSPPAP